MSLRHTDPPLNERTGWVVTLIVSAGALLLFHQLSIGIVVACATQLQILLFHWVCGNLLDGQPVQRLLSREDILYRHTLESTSQHNLNRIDNHRYLFLSHVGCKLPLFAGQFFWFRTPSHRNKAQVV